jgi:hypothetical protein
MVRTTLCDVVVQKGERYSFVVDPLPDEEVNLLADELCRSVFKKDVPNTVRTEPSEFRPPEEVGHLLEF